MGDNKLKFSKIAFPSDLYPNKDDESFGLQVGKAINFEWFRGGNSCSFYSKAAEFHRLRLYARGEQDPGQYKSKVVATKDLSWMNLDWKIVKIAPKFVDIVLNGINTRMYEVRAEAQDAMSAEKKNLYQDAIEADMVSKKFLQITQQEFGVDGFSVPQEELPETDEELALYMQLRYKPSIEIATEIGISTLLELNDYQEIDTQVKQDIIEIGVGGTRRWFSPSEGLKIEAVDPATMVWSEVKKKDFSDAYYFGYVHQVHYTEIRKIAPHLSDDQIEEIKTAASVWFEEFPIAQRYHDSALADELITLMFFNYKTEKQFVYKKKTVLGGGSKMIKKDHTFNPEPNELFEKYTKTKEVWYSGVMVPGTDYILKWEMCENQVRPKSATQKSLSEFSMYAPRMYKGIFDSLVKRMIPFLDSIQVDHLKLQQIKSRMVPDGVSINVDMLAEVNLGGVKYGEEEALNMYFQTGSAFSKSVDTEGDFVSGDAIRELTKSGAGNKIQSIMNSYNHNLNMIHDVTGLNSASDASSPNADALVGVQKLAALNSNVATRHILMGGHNVLKRTAEGIFLNISDILKFSDFSEEFAMMIGKYNRAILNDIKDIHLYSMGIFIEISPDAEERDALERDINTALGKGTIELEDAIDIRSIKNIKVANELLKVKQKTRRKQREQREDFVETQRAQQQQTLQESAHQSKMEAIKAEADAKAYVKQMEGQMDSARMEKEAQLKMVLMEKEFEYNIQLAGITSSELLKRESRREDRKDERVNLSATRQSEVLEQKQKELPAKTFESSEDSLDGFDFGSFGPK